MQSIIFVGVTRNFLSLNAILKCLYLFLRKLIAMNSFNLLFNSLRIQNISVILKK